MNASRSMEMALDLLVDAQYELRRSLEDPMRRPISPTAMWEEDTRHRVAILGGTIRRIENAINVGRVAT